MASYTYDFIELGEEHSLGCKCCRFKNGTDLPVPKKLSLDEIEILAREFSHSIFADWTKLNAIIKRFEAVIQKRWLKKSIKQKREILLKAWPNMSATHRPDFVHFRVTNRRDTPRSRTRPSEAYLWPYINLEDLQQHHMLLLFLNSRGRNLPELFIGGDMLAAHLGKGWGFPEESDKPCPWQMAMQFTSLRSPLSYGQMIPWDIARCIPTIEPFDPLYGLLGMEIQHGIYSFLLACATLILHDIEPSQFLIAPHQPEPTLPLTASDEWPSLAAHMKEASYRAPQQMDLERLKVLVSTRRAAAENHVWMLREDPAYFVDSLKDWHQHSQAQVTHSCAKEWQATGADMVCNASSNIVSWDAIGRIIERMAPLDAQLKRADWRGMRLETRDEVGWATLINIVASALDLSLSNLATGFPASPRMRTRYDWDAWRLKGPSGTSIWDMRSLRQPFSNAESRIDMLFYALTHNDERKLHGLNNLVQEIQYMLDTDADASQLLDSWIIEQFSDVAMLSELQERIKGFRPWSTKWWTARVHDSKAVQMNVKMFDDLEMKLGMALCEAVVESKSLRDQLNGPLDYPVGKQHTEANVAQMRHAEQTLDEFWTGIEVRVKKLCGLSFDNVIKKRLTEPRKKHRTPEWVPPLVPMKKPAALTEISTNIIRFRQCLTESSETPTKSKTKIKTRGVASPPSNSEVRAQDPPTEEQSAEAKCRQIKVPKRAFKVFAALLPDSNAESHQRVEISWDELLQAMNTIGLAPEKLYGSVWIFKPKSQTQCLVGDLGRSIQFHEPKQVRKGNKIPANFVRVFGRRLKYAYGWEGGMFVCE